MSYNPPDTRDEIRDTLGFMGIPYKYEKLNTPKGHVFSFALTDGSGDINIYSPSYITWTARKKRVRFHSAYEAKVELLSFYRSLI
jgi:hypothetical protein